MWTATSWHALVDSYGVGVGVGSTRASSSVVGVTSSTGFLGALLFYGFVVQTMTRRAKPHDPEGALLLSAVRWSFLPPFAISLMIGISADFGPILAFLLGLSAAVAFSTSRPAPAARMFQPGTAKRSAAAVSGANRGPATFGGEIPPTEAGGV